MNMEPDNDDLPVGRVLSRREILGLFGVTGLGLIFGCSSNTVDTSGTDITSDNSTCAVRPEMTEGPYFVDEKLNRSDIRTDPGNGTVKDGTILALLFNVSKIAGSGCTPIEGATVDVWHCDALGVYSDVTDRGFSTVGQKFLRGYQTTDAQGQAQFVTIYPGWYSGRTVHIHFKIRTTEGHEFTSQLFFNDSLTDQVYAQAPYAAKGTRDTRNANDGIYNGGGSNLILAATPAAEGYTATFNIALQI